MSIVENLKKNYNDEFIIDIDRWELLEKGIHVLWGPSGSGKSSIFRILIGLETCPGLRWQWGSEDLAQLKPADRNLGVVFQSLDLFPHLSARQNAFFPVRARKLNKENATQRYQKLKDILRLENFEDRQVEVLSGGERQRVAIARALMSFPRMLLLDEAFSALDEALRDEARKLLKVILEETQTPALLITHDERDLKILADRVSKIENGRIKV